MKQQDATPVLVGDTTFYIRPFPAFKSANIFGQLTKTITPVAGGLLSLVGGTGDEKSIFDLNLEEAAPALAGAVSGLSGTVVETLLRQLLVDYGNIAYDDPETGQWRSSRSTTTVFSRSSPPSLALPSPSSRT